MLLEEFMCISLSKVSLVEENSSIFSGEDELDKL